MPKISLTMKNTKRKLPHKFCNMHRQECLGAGLTATVQVRVRVRGVRMEGREGLTGSEYGWTAWILDNQFNTALIFNSSLLFSYELCQLECPSAYCVLARISRKARLGHGLAQRIVLS